MRMIDSLKKVVGEGAKLSIGTEEYNNHRQIALDICDQIKRLGV